MNPGVLAEFLQARLGQKLAAEMVGLSDRKQLGRYQKVEGPKPRSVVEMRMREAYKLTSMIESQFDSGVAASWLSGTNFRLGDRSPSELIREADSPTDFATIRAAARQFVLSQATVRDPTADIEAVRAAQARPMEERLELALSWNLLASELKAEIADAERVG